MKDNDPPLRNANDFPLRNIATKMCFSAVIFVPPFLENEPFDLRETSRSVRQITVKRTRKLSTQP